MEHVAQVVDPFVFRLLGLAIQHRIEVPLDEFADEARHSDPV